MNDHYEDDDKAFDDEVKAVKYAIGRLAAYPNEVAGACLRGLTPTAIDMVANAADDTLDEAAGNFGDPSVYEALRFMCRAFLTLRQAKRLAEILSEAAP
jgi:hypothetical protein